VLKGMEDEDEELEVEVDLDLVNEISIFDSLICA
jgi:hypothetical protein